MAITLRAARINKGLTQKEAAILLKVSEESLSNYENGKTYPTVPLLKRIEKVYGIGYNDLFFLPEDTL